VSNILRRSSRTAAKSSFNKKLQLGSNAPLLLGIRITSFQSVNHAASRLADLVGRSDVGVSVYTCNVDHVMLMRRNPRFRRAYEQADIVTADGAPIVLLARMVRTPVGPRVTGADLVPAIAAEAADRQQTVVLVGGSEQSAGLAMRRLEIDFPGIASVRTYSPSMGFVVGGQEDTSMVKTIQQWGPSYVIVCLGAPKQELWIDQHRSEFPGAVLLGAGAAIDFISGEQSRAPRLFQRTGAEWLYRLCTNFPRLWRRYLVRDAGFIWIASLELSRALRRTHE
jgi:N-acetylglucosaminyldiphosphoundecaprenol N-acetyl-beta-D-mannosaminyltransferase